MLTPSCVLATRGSAFASFEGGELCMLPTEYRDQAPPRNLQSLRSPGLGGDQHPVSERDDAGRPPRALEHASRELPHRTGGFRLVDVVDEGFDVVIRISRLQDSTLVHRRLASTRLLICASPEYLAQHGMPASVEDIARHRVIAYSYAAQGDVWRFTTPQGEQEVQTKPHVRTNNGDTCRALALAHQGLVKQPDF
ncbi:MAG: hypothetical protein CVU63_19455, partial [Deltaproteobacteria bacterium HGW-Deltaproteobacteria-20]